ncbi:uncharacterized protein J3D65DRAFT_695913 [Phyllosticta citribraziliensis]|uniref:Uncharacterized protein n=1 Tax=Phyllosticta citribraziliensis TaxID=989973 RepID=A0ABR1LQL0_9PEZI
MMSHELKALLWFMFKLDTIILALVVVTIDAWFAFPVDRSVAPALSMLSMQVAMGAAAYYVFHMVLYMSIPCRVQERHHINPRILLLVGLLSVALVLGIAVVLVAMDWPGDLENAACAGTGVDARWDCGILFGARYCTVILLAFVLAQIFMAMYVLPADNWEIPFPVGMVRDLFRRLRYLFRRYIRGEGVSENEGIPLRTLGDRGRPERRANGPEREIILFGPFRHPGSPRSPESEIRSQGQVLHAAAEEHPATPTLTSRHRRTISRNSVSGSLTLGLENE